MADRAVIRCAQCGFDNEPGHIYCAKCKAKLNLDQISSKSFELAPRRSLRVQLLQFVLLVFIICFAFALWPMPVDEVSYSAREFAMIKNRLQRLQQGALAEPMEFSEKEVNILFVHLIQENRRRPSYKPGLISLSAGKLTLEDDALTITMFYQVGPLSLGSFQLGPFWTSYEVTGRPVRAPEGMQFAALRGVAGHLPLPFIGGVVGKNRLLDVFSHFENARNFLSKLEIVAMRKGKVVVTIRR